MEQLMDQSVLIQAIHSYAHALGNLNRNGMMAPFASDRPMTYDLSSYFGGEPQQWRPQDLYDSACSTLGGFNSTQHFVGKPDVTFHNDYPSKATIKAPVCAYHWIQTEASVEGVIARGEWIVEAEKEGTKWLFRRFRFASAATMPMQDVSTYAKAAERVKQGFNRAQVVT